MTRRVPCYGCGGRDAMWRAYYHAYPDKPANWCSDCLNIQGTLKDKNTYIGTFGRWILIEAEDPT